jgi:RNA polymerase sigma-70 factor (ECF subfamily)
MLSNEGMEAKSDAYYINEVLKGNSESFAPLVEKYKLLAFSLSMKIIRNREDAEEAAQDAFIKAFKSLDNFKGNSTFKTWFFRIVYTTAISKVRGKQNNLVSFEDHILTEREMTDTENTVSQLNAEERAYQLHKALDLLGSEERAILNFYYFEDLPVEEIATIMDMTASNIKIKLFRSRKRLYEKLYGLIKCEDAFVF